MLLRRRSLLSKEVYEREMPFSLDEYQTYCQGQIDYPMFEKMHDLDEKDMFFIRYGCSEEEVKFMKLKLKQDTGNRIRPYV